MFSSAAALIVLAFVGLCSFEPAEADDLKTKLQAIAGECSAETNGNPDSFTKAWDEHIVSENENDKCLFACMMKKFGALSDGKFNIDVINTLIPERHNNPETVEAIKKLNEGCVAQVKMDGGDCMPTYDLVTCMVQRFKEAGLGPSK